MLDNAYGRYTYSPPSYSLPFIDSSSACSCVFAAGPSTGPCGGRPGYGDVRVIYPRRGVRRRPLGRSSSRPSHVVRFVCWVFVSVRCDPFFLCLLARIVLYPIVIGRRDYRRRTAGYWPGSSEHELVVPAISSLSDGFLCAA